MVSSTLLLLPAFFSGMASFKDLAQRLDVHLGADGSHFKAGVAEKLLDEADVGTPVVQVGRAAVPQNMRSAFGDVGRAEVFSQGDTKSVGVEASSVAGEALFPVDLVFFLHLSDPNSILENLIFQKSKSWGPNWGHRASTTSASSPGHNRTGKNRQSKWARRLKHQDSHTLLRRDFSILQCEHQSHHACGFLRIGRIFTPPFEDLVIIVDIKEQLLISSFNSIQNIARFEKPGKESDLFSKVSVL